MEGKGQSCERKDYFFYRRVQATTTVTYNLKAVNGLEKMSSLPGYPSTLSINIGKEKPPC